MGNIKENNMSLGSIYDSIKDNTQINSNPLIGSTPKGDSLKLALIKKGNSLKDNCYKHILLDIYCKILPLDQEYVDGHMGQMSDDIDSMLKSKDMGPTQYITACHESTKAPLLDFIISSVNKMGKTFVEEAEKKIEDANKEGYDIPIPEVPEDPTTDENINDQIVDVTNDTEYDAFVDTLKKKTIDKIVSDVTKIINDKDEDSNMTFDPKSMADIQESVESTTSLGINYLQKKLIKENVDVSNITEELMGYAIRESTLNQFNIVFKQQGGTFKEFASRIKYGKGMIINESAVESIVKSNGKSSEEIDGVVKKAKKEMDDKINSKLKASEVINAKESDNKSN